MPPIIEVMSTPPKKSRGIASKAQTVIKADLPAVTVHLSDVNREETLPDRIITLENPTWTFDIGRGSSSDDTIIPAPDNAWFASKVMSRQHAILKADPENKLLTIRDAGSMHGTYLNGDRVGHNFVELLEDDIITFGMEIVRQAESFAPLKTRVSFEWHQEDTAVAKKPNTVVNTFTADYSEEDLYSDYDDEVEIIKETLVLDPVDRRQTQRDPSIEILNALPVPKQAASSVKTSPSMNSNSAASSSSSIPTSSPSVEAAKELPDLDARLDSEADELFGTAPLPNVSVDLDESDQETDYEEEYDEEEDIDEYEQEYEEEDEEVASDQENELPAWGSDFDKDRVATKVLSESQNPRQPSPSDAALAKVLWPGQSKGNEAIYSSTPFNNVHNAYGNAGVKSVFSQDRRWPEPSFASQNNNQFGSSTIYGQLLPLPLPAAASNMTHYSVPIPPPTAQQPHAWPNSPAYTFSSVDNNSSEGWRSHDAISMVERLHKLKRKADDISQYEQPPPAAQSFPSHQPSASSTADPPQIDLSSSPLDEPVLAEAISDNHEQTAGTAEIEENLAIIVDVPSTASDLNGPVSPLESRQLVDEPARKKVKLDKAVTKATQDSSSIGTFTKYATTALAGATIGAIGTVIGLASLPSDYFV